MYYIHGVSVKLDEVNGNMNFGLNNGTPAVVSNAGMISFRVTSSHVTIS